MDLENLKDVKEHKADYCYVEIEKIEHIIEYLKQLDIIAQNKENER